MAKNQEKSSLKDYRQGFLIGIIIIATGFLFDGISGGRGIALPTWPMNLYVILSFAFNSCLPAFLLQRFKDSQVAFAGTCLHQCNCTVYPAHTHYGHDQTKQSRSL